MSTPFEKNLRPASHLLRGKRGNYRRRNEKWGISNRLIQQARAEVISYVCAMLESLGPEDAASYIRIQKKIWTNFQQNH